MKTAVFCVGLIALLICIMLFMISTNKQTKEKSVYKNNNFDDKN